MSVIPKPRPRPLPVRLRPLPGENSRSYIERLARANHLTPHRLRLYLSATRQAGGPVVIERLAILSGRPLPSLRRALSDLSCGHCGGPLAAQPMGLPAPWCAPAYHCSAECRRQSRLQFQALETAARDRSTETTPGRTTSRARKTETEASG